MKRWTWWIVAAGILALAWGGKRMLTGRMSGKRWENLHPEVRRKFFLFEAAAAAAGVPVLFWDGWRDLAGQAGMISSGVSFVSDPLSSFHPWGLAFDAPLKSPLGTPSWPPVDDPRWAVIGRIGKELGFEWGGDWAQKDMAHFQLRLASPAQLKSLYNRDPLAFLKAQGVFVA